MLDHRCAAAQHRVEGDLERQDGEERDRQQQVLQPWPPVQTDLQEEIKSDWAGFTQSMEL